VEIEQALAGYLQPGEQVLWTGRPDPRVWLTSADVFAVPFSVIFLSFAVIWERQATSVGAPHAFGLVGYLFIAVGCYLLAGRPVVAWSARRRTRYAVTDRRALMITPRTMTDSPLAGQPVALRRSRSGRVSADIGTPVPRYSTAAGSTMMGPDGTMSTMPSRRTVRYVAPVRFQQVADGDAMIAALNQARSGAAHS